MELRIVTMPQFQAQLRLSEQTSRDSLPKAWIAGAKNLRRPNQASYLPSTV